MRPVLFSCWKVTVRSYPAMLYFGLVAGVMAGNLVAHATGINPLRTYIATLVLIFLALVGSRILYVATHPLLLRSGFVSFWGRQEGGYSMYGGLPAALLASIPVLHFLRLSFGAFWDVAIFTILVGMIFARIGCLMNGCCCGRSCDGPLGLYLPDTSGLWKRRLPTQIFEALLAVLLLASGIALRSHLHTPGTLFLVLAAGYAAARFVLEFAREEQAGTRALTSAHWISLVTLVSSGSLLAFCWLG
jgi:phosphatidylglycerol:prolipoprotein diacylglycerol transferase